MRTLSFLVMIAIVGGCGGDALAPPVILEQPAAQSVVGPDAATFFVVATASEPPAYQWLRDGTPIDGATDASYTTPPTAPADSGARFTVTISNDAGSVTSAPATLIVAAAPAITAQPDDQSVIAPAAATFAVEAEGAELAYQWLRDGAPIDGATAASYTTPATTGADAGARFSVLVTGSGRTVLSDPATLAVIVTPSIISSPASTAVTAPTPASFAVVATGSALAYQWSRDGVMIAGATAASYTTPATSTADSGATFTVTVTNDAGSVTSGVASLTVSDAPVAPSLAAEPQDQDVIAPATATFAVSANGTAPLTYQWLRDGAPIAGATAASYTTPPTSAADDAAIFSVLVRNDVGTVLSTSATLGVTVAPAITASPASVSVAAPSSATFTVSATGSAPLVYQWLRDGAPIAGANAATYQTPSTSLLDDGASFTVLVSNAAGDALSAAALLQVDPTAGAVPTISQQPTDEATDLDGTSTFTVIAAGTPAPTYQWLRNGTPIAGATAASYTTPPAALADRGASFRVVVSNVHGSIVSQPATLGVRTGIETVIATGRRGIAVTLPDGRVFLGSGVDGYRVWDPITSSFEAPLEDPIGTDQSNAVATLLATGEILITSGSANPAAEIYDPASRTFRPTAGDPAHLHSNGRHQAATLLPDGRVLYAGDQLTTDAELYVPATDTFEPTTGPLVYARASAGSVLLPSGKVLIAGGRGGDATSELFDPMTGTFSETGHLTQSGTRCHGIHLLGGGVLLGCWIPAFGNLFDEASGFTAGYVGTGNRPTALLPSGKVLYAENAVVFDPITHTFASNTAGPTAELTGQATLRDGRVVLVDSAGNVFVFDPQEPAPLRLPDATLTSSPAPDGDYTISVPAQPGMTFHWLVTGAAITAGLGTAQITVHPTGAFTVDALVVNERGVPAHAHLDRTP